jgi:hypothetical protein
LYIPLKSDGVVLERVPGCEMWPVCLSTIVTLWVKPPGVLVGSFWGSKEMFSPGCFVGGVREICLKMVVLLEHPSRQCGQGS